MSIIDRLKKKFSRSVALKQSKLEAYRNKIDPIKEKNKILFDEIVRDFRFKQQLDELITHFNHESKKLELEGPYKCKYEEDERPEPELSMLNDLELFKDDHFDSELNPDWMQSVMSIDSRNVKDVKDLLENLINKAFNRAKGNIPLTSVLGKKPQYNDFWIEFQICSLLLYRAIFLLKA